MRCDAMRCDAMRCGVLTQRMVSAHSVRQVHARDDCDRGGVLRLRYAMSGTDIGITYAFAMRCPVLRQCDVQY
eukprot:1475118-Rhodomonas_salina.2